MGAGALEPDPPLLWALTKSQRRNQQHKRSRQKKTAARTHERQVGVPFLCVSTRLPWALGKVAASVEKQFGPSAEYSKFNRAADLLCNYLLALVHGAVEEGEVLGVEFAGDEVGEVAGLHQSPTKPADDKAGNAFRCRSTSLSRRAQLRPRACRVLRRASLQFFGSLHLS